MRFALALLLGFGSLRATSFTAKWNYDFTGSTFCSGTTQTNCVDHFEVGLVTGANVFVPVANATLPPNPVGPAAGITSPAFTIAAGFGMQTVAVVMVAKDATGNRITSSPQQAAVTVAIAPNAPTGLVVTSQ